MELNDAITTGIGSDSKFESCLSENAAHRKPGSIYLAAYASSQQIRQRNAKSKSMNNWRQCNSPPELKESAPTASSKRRFSNCAVD
jgi:hypothetical protein